MKMPPMNIAKLVMYSHLIALEYLSIHVCYFCHVKTLCIRDVIAQKILLFGLNIIYNFLKS